MKSLGSAFAITIVLSLLGPAAYAQNCKNASPGQIKDDVIRIDAKNGSFEGPRKFRVRDKTQVILFDKNPFRYSYVLTIKDAVIVEDAIGKFLTLAGISADASKAPTPASAKAKETATEHADRANARQRKAEDACKVEARSLEHANDALNASADKLKKAVAGAVNAYTALSDRVKANLGDTNATGPELCENAKQAVADISAYKVDPTLATDTDAFSKAIEAQAEAIANFKSHCKADVTELSDALKADRKIVTWAGTKIDALTDQKTALDKLAGDVKTILDRAGAFWESRALGPFNESTEVTISVTRKDTTVADSKDETIRPDVKVLFGEGKRFFIAGGIASTAAHRRQFNTVDGFIRDRNGNFVNDASGNPRTGKVVGLEEDSVGRVAPAVLLHGILKRTNGFIDGIGLSLGVGAAGTDDSLLQYFVGPTLSFAEDHLFVTVGAFRGSEKKLNGDFFVGAEVPANTTVTTTDRRTWTFGFSLTYRIQ